MKKCLKIIFPALCVLLPYLFYMLLGELSIILPLFLACSLCGIASDSLYKNDNICLILLILSILPLAALMLAPFYYSHLLFGWWWLVLPASLLLIYVLKLIIRIFIRLGRFFKGVIALRKIMALLMVMTAALFMVPGIFSLIGQEFGHSLDERIIGTFGSLGWLSVFVIPIYQEKKRVYLFSNYCKPYYILFLRRFIKDGNPQVQECLDALLHNTSGLSIMQIGNPQTLLFSSSSYDTVYLPSTNWKPYLKKYINCARLVFSIIDTSEGVIWEMVENVEHLKKYIYCILDWEQIDEIKRRLNEHTSLNGELNIKFQRFLSYMQAQEAKEMTMVAFESNKIIYTSNMMAMLEYKLTSKRGNDLQVLSI